MNTYKIIENNETDPTAIKVEKGGITTEFTIATVLNENETFRKYIREGEGQLKLEEQIMANVLEHHPALATLSAEDLFAAGMYQAAFVKANKLKDSLGNIEVELTEGEKTLAEITEALGIVIPTKENIIDAAVAKVVDETDHAG